MTKKYKFLLFALLFYTMSIGAQSTFCVGGNISNASPMYLTSTIGEPISGALERGGLILHQGQQQPTLSLFGTGKYSIGIDAIIYPNPTTDIIFIRIENYNGPSLVAELTNILGQSFGGRAIDGVLTTFNLSALADGVYILSLKDEANQQIRSFKVIKK